MMINWMGILLGFGGVIGGQLLEGGHLEQLIQPTAAMIVAGGTMGATLISSTMAEFMGAVFGVLKIFMGGGEGNLKKQIQEFVAAAQVARKEGILALEKVGRATKNKFFAEHLRHVIDGYDPKVVVEMMEEAIHHAETEKMAIAKVFETAGGFSPTIGIIGAVLGLIHVMSNLSDSSKLGSGIAVAFVATVYGVGAANLLLLPMGNKYKKIAKAEVETLSLTFTAIQGIQAGLNPRIIEEQLYNVVGMHASSGAAGGGGQAAKAA